MSDLLLTDEERRRFSLWLRREAAGCIGIAEQAEKAIPGPAGRLFSVRERSFAAACVCVAERIDATESDSIGSA